MGPAPGPYIICHVNFDESDAGTYNGLMFGYDTAEQAYAALEKVAQEAGVPANECGVIRAIDPKEASDFDC